MASKTSSTSTAHCSFVRDNMHSMARIRAKERSISYSISPSIHRIFFFIGLAEVMYSCEQFADRLYFSNHITVKVVSVYCNKNGDE